MSGAAAELRVAAVRLIAAAGELAAKHVYLDPHDAANDFAARAYCALCLRYGLNCTAIDHAPSCTVGRMVECVKDLRAKLLAEWDGVEEPARRGEYRIEYFVENPRHRFNAYMHPCPAMREGVVCEMELGHGGAHCSDGAVWADDGRLWGLDIWRLA